jgi:hypothetical protein
MSHFLGNKLIKFIIQLSFILQAKCDIFASLLNFVDRHDFPSLKHFIDPFSFGVMTVFSAPWGLQQARQIAIALFATHPIIGDLID